MKKLAVLFSVIALGVIAHLYLDNHQVQGDNTPSQIEMVKCLKSKGVTMYGTEWCPHCKHQKEVFGKYFSEINYVDCDKQRGLCRKKGILGYPTWLNSEGKELRSGTIAEIAAQSECTVMATSPYTTGADPLNDKSVILDCLNSKGLTMYGTSWCPHCQHQKKILGEDFEKLNYVDCDKQRKLCRKKRVAGYPTWLLENGQEIPQGNLEELAVNTGCNLH